MSQIDAIDVESGVTKMLKASTKLPEEVFGLNDYVLLLFNEQDSKIALTWADCPPRKRKSETRREG